MSNWLALYAMAAAVWALACCLKLEDGGRYVKTNELWVCFLANLVLAPAMMVISIIHRFFRR